MERKRLPVEGLPDARFHLIGHLQSNKAKKAAELFHAVETIDSGEHRLDAAAGETKPLDVLLEVKLSHPDRNPVHRRRKCLRLSKRRPNAGICRLLGLMTVPPWSEDAELSRPYFARLRELAAAHGLQELSMGMSHDLGVAIEEGATWVRVGTALFGKRVKP
jgi:uncharacterized pyridoxal phosphate-containing UPF0001 family protein